MEVKSAIKPFNYGSQRHTPERERDSTPRLGNFCDPMCGSLLGSQRHYSYFKALVFLYLDSEYMAAMLE
jgi:hypothetical protein